MNAFLALGWLGNACFFARFFFQWWASERARRSVAPSVFWWLSLAGAVALGAYSAERGEPVLLAGYAVTTCIYARNLWLVDRPQRSAPNGAWIGAFGVAATLLLFSIEGIRLRGGFAHTGVWLAVGIAGQALWSSRFILQWALSERSGTSHFPRSFWWVSLVGNALMLAYAVHLRDAVYIAGFVPGPFVQVRNLMLGRAFDRAPADA
ncbi:MAG: lipid-A-disaccharide synthase N-terminal domain-containing protein [Planctomycetota bacterium]